MKNKWFAGLVSGLLICSCSAADEKKAEGEKIQARIDTVGAPDDESDRASLVAPAVDLLGELSAGRVCAAFIHDDLDGILRQGGPNPFRFGLHHFRDGALVPVFGFDGL